MKKNNYAYLLIAAVLIIAVVIWRCYLVNYLSSFHQFDEWGIYLFAIPVAYCFGMFMFASAFNQSSLKIIAIAFVGVLIPILLSKTNDFILQKIAMTIVGAIATWVAAKIFR